MQVGNVERVIGQEGTFAQGRRASYLYREWPDNYVDELEADGGTVFLRDQSGVGRALHFEGNRFRTIVSSVSFSAMGERYRDSLMATYVRYLTAGAGLEDGNRVAPRSRGLTVAPNIVRVGQTVTINADNGANRIDIFDKAGRHTAGWPSTPNVDTDWVARVPAGTYFVLRSGTGSAQARRLTVLER
jgi:hypothetical protein